MTNGILSAIRTTLSGLSVNMRKMEVISENMANVEKSPDENGNVYQKKVVEFGRQTRARRSRFADALKMNLKKSNGSHIQPGGSSSRYDQKSSEIKVVEKEGEKLVYNPTHPKADEKGFVKMPDINMIEEMVGLIGASRTYEANVTVINAAKQMAKKSLEI
jgi:flagellar basal-body rod protein FlgC